MLITIPTTSTSLVSLAGSLASYITNSEGAHYNVILQNLGATNVYFDFSIDATTTGGVKVASGSNVSYSTQYLDKINLISEGSDNTNIRLSIS